MGKRTFSPEFKLEAIKLVRERGSAAAGGGSSRSSKRPPTPNVRSEQQGVPRHPPCLFADVRVDRVPSCCRA
jgi:hypothetical protein